MRGAPRITRHLPVRYWIIPAYAGSTRLLRALLARQWDHPRVCGEHLCSAMEKMGNGGSSPRMRGARRRIVLDGRPKGIIPAYAGSTAGATDQLTTMGDHPRVCGEHIYLRKREKVDGGSSPRMRGAPLQAVVGSVG